MSKVVDMFLTNYSREMTFDIFKRIRDICDASDEAKANYHPEPENLTIRAGGTSGVGAAIAGNGSITRYVVDRAVSSREIFITLEDDGRFKVSADGNYRIAEDGEGTAGWDDQLHATPAGEWKDEKTGELPRAPEMRAEAVLTDEAQVINAALKYAGSIKSGTCESALKSRGTRYKCDPKDVAEVDAIIARQWND